jgi:hypothetical protein
MTVLALLVVFAVGCSSTPAPQVEPNAPPLTKFSPDEIKAEVPRLLTAHKTPDVEKEKLVERLTVVLDHPEVKAQLAEPGVTGVGVYVGGSGGFILQGGGGDGLVHFKGETGYRKIRISSYKVGAVIGGGSQRGFFLVCGLAHAVLLAGDYTFSGAGAMAGGDDAVNTGTGNSETGSHLIRFHAIGKGLAASAGTGRFSVTFEE